jgi:hypothetical protein
MSSPRDYYLTFSGAATREIRARGRFLRVLEAPAAAVFLAFDGSTELERRAGQGVNYGGTFNRFTVRSTVAQTVLVCVSDDRQDDDQESVSVSVSATVTPGNTLSAGGDVSIPALSSQQLAAADADRLALIVANPVNNTDPVRVGGSGVNASSGIELQPGDSITIASTAAVYGYNPKGSAQSVQVLPVQDV